MPLGAIAIVAGAILWSTGGVSVKWLQADAPHVSGLAVSSGRAIFTALFFLALARGRIGMPRRGRGWFLAGVLTYAYVVTSFVLSTRLTTAANAILLQYTAPIWVMLVGWPLLGEKPSPRDGLALFLGGIGVVLCCQEGLRLPGQGGSGFSRQALGDLMGLSSGVAFGLFSVVLRFLRRDEGAGVRPATSLAILFWGNALAALIGGPALVAAWAESPLPAAAVGVLIWLGVGQLGLGYYLFQRGLRSVTALHANMLSLIEPVLNPVWVAWAVHEIPSRGTLLGGAFVLGAMVLSALPGRSRRPR